MSLQSGGSEKTRCGMRTKMTSALLLSVACFAILSLFGWTRQESDRTADHEPGTDDETTLFVG